MGDIGMIIWYSIGFYKDLNVLVVKIIFLYICIKLDVL